MDSNNLCGMPVSHLLRGKMAALVLGCLLSLVAWSQSIKIPDFRQPPPAVATYRAGEICEQCGRILSVREITTQRKPVVPQAFQSTGGPGMPSGPGGPNLVGAVVYLPFGGSSTDQSFVGGVGTPEMQERFRENTYEITIRLDEGGAIRVIQRHDGTRYRAGDRVRLAGVNDLELVVE